MNLLGLFLRGFKEGTQDFGQTVGSVLNAVLLSAIYFVGVGIPSIFTKIIGKRFLKTKIEKKSDSYWEDANIGKEPIKSYYRQF